MSDPYDEPVVRWGLVFYGSGMHHPSHTRHQRVLIADAIRVADQLHTDVDGVRGNAIWCQRALEAYRQLTAASPPTMAADLRPSSDVDEHVVRGWLDAPAVPIDDQPATMAEAAGWDTAFADDPPDPERLSLLVDLAQEAGVFALPDHRVSLLRWVDNGVTRDDAFLVLLWPPHGPARGSSATSIGDLVQPGSTTTDTIIGFLSNVAAVANELLDAHPATDPPRTPAERVEPPPLPGHVQGWHTGNPARVFPPLRLVHPAPQPRPDPPDAPPAQPRPHRSP